MGTKSNNSPGEKSRFRFILVEGEVTTGEIQQFAQTFAAAVRAPQLPARPQFPSHAASLPAAKLPADASLFDDVMEEEAVEAAPAPTPAAKPSNGAKKKLRTPQPVPGLEFTSGAKPLKEYLDGQQADGDAKRYLAITWWLREYRSIAEVGADHIYSCYRALGWNVPNDVLSVFRNLKRQAWVEKGTEQGMYKINHIGEGQLNKAA